MNGEHLAFDREYGTLVAGVDEAGCSPLSGPVVAGAVIFRCTPPSYLIENINDSKKLSEKRREQLYEEICRYSVHAVGVASPKEIEEINIYHASILAMKRAVENLSIKPKIVLADGNRKCNFGEIKHHSIIRGDEKSLSIAAGSIIAKVYRDSIMKDLAEIYPEYGWKSNKGYPCKKHTDAIKKYGITAIHRRNWKAVQKRMMNTFRLGEFEISHKRVKQSEARCESCNKEVSIDDHLVMYGQSTKTEICLECFERAVSWQKSLASSLVGSK